MTINTMQRRMKRDDLTVDGFRSTFRDWAAECTTFAAEVTEMALAHSVSDKVEATYRRGDLFGKRRQLAEAWGAALLRARRKMWSSYRRRVEQPRRFVVTYDAEFRRAAVWVILSPMAIIDDYPAIAAELRRLRAEHNTDPQTRPLSWRPMRAPASGEAPLDDWFLR